MIGIFLESNESLGLLYNRYKDMGSITDKFIDDVNKIANKESYDEDKLSDTVETYKNTVKGTMKSPEPVNPRTTDKERRRVKIVKDKLDDTLYKLSKLWMKYEGFKTNTGKSFPSLKSAITCARRVLIDTMNLCDQDLNLLSLVDKVYYRKVYESEWDNMMSDGSPLDDFMESSLDSGDSFEDEIFDSLYRSYIESKKEKEENKEENKVNLQKDFLDQPLEDSNEKYYPIFPMSVAYNYGPAYTFMAPIIHKVTNGDEYTHSFMSFDPEFKTILTFGGKGLEYMTVEDYEAFKYSKSVCVYVVWLTKDELNDIKRVIKDYNDNPKDVRFSLINFFSMMLGKIKRKDKSHCCSAFLGYLLNAANKKNLTKDYSQTRPEDVTMLPRSFFVGTFKDLEDLKEKRPEFKKRIDKIYDDNIDDIREYNNSIPRVMLTDNIKRHKKDLKKFYKDMATK